MGPVNSATWSLLLDGAENILKEEGYASLTSRRIAERVGIKQQLTYYYFRTMDELMVEAFRRLSKSNDRDACRPALSRNRSTSCERKAELPHSLLSQSHS
jgi:AcrR family transcriptional regulator